MVLIIQPLIQYVLLPSFPKISQDFKIIQPQIQYVLIPRFPKISKSFNPLFNMSFSRDFPSFQDYSTIDSICPSPKIYPNFKIIQPLIQYGLLPRFPQISQDFKNIQPLIQYILLFLSQTSALFIE